MYKYIIYKKKSLQSFRSYLHFWENVVCKFLKIRAVLQSKNAWTKRHIIDRGCSMVKSGI